MKGSNFLTTVSYPNRNTTCSEKLLAMVDGYLHLDCLRCRRVQVIEPGRAVLCKNTPPSSWLATVLKVASYALLIPLLVALILKVLLHCVHRFILIEQLPSVPIKKARQEHTGVFQNDLITKLPRDIFNLVCNYLTADEEAKCRRTSRSHTQASVPILRERLQQLPPGQQTHFKEAFYPGITSLTLNSYPIDSEIFKKIWVLLVRCKFQLKNFFPPSSIPMKGVMLVSVAKGFPQLIALGLDNCQLLRDEEIPESCLPNLQILLISQAPHLSDQGLSKLVRGASVTMLSLINCSQIQGSLGPLPHLTSFNIMNCAELNAKGLNRLLSHCNLGELTIGHLCLSLHLEQLADRNLDRLVSLKIANGVGATNLLSRMQTPCIEKFSLTGCEEIRGEDCLPFLSSGQLQELIVTSCAQFGDIPLFPSTSLIRLKRIELSQLANLRKEDLALLLSGKKVRDLYLSFCPQLLGGLLQGQDFSSLVYLYIVSCERFSEESIRALINGSKLEMLNLMAHPDFKAEEIEQASAERLWFLSLTRLPNLTGLGLAALLSGKKVKTLTVWSCNQIDGVHCNREDLLHLTDLKLHDLPALSSEGAASFLSLPQLSTLDLDLTTCREILSPPVDLPMLQNLTLVGASKLTPRAFLTLLSSPCLKILKIEAEDRVFFTREGSPLREEILERLEELGT